jgi:hypothetical protein
MMSALLLIVATFAADDAAPPPLTSEQLEAVRALVQRTQAEQTAARKALVTAQEELARCYAAYDLDLKQVEKLHAEIIDQQRKLLASHHRLHTELRMIVSGPRFEILSRRIENALRNPPPSAKDEPAPPPKPSQK